MCVGDAGEQVVVKKGQTVKLGTWTAPAALVIDWEWFKEEKPQKPKEDYQEQCLEGADPDLLPCNYLATATV